MGYLLVGRYWLYAGFCGCLVVGYFGFRLLGLVRLRLRWLCGCFLYCSLVLLCNYLCYVYVPCGWYDGSVCA